MMQHPVGIDKVEAAIREWNICAASMRDASKISDPLTGQTKMLRRDVNPDSVGTMLGELKQVAAGTTANLKHALPGMLAKFSGVI